MRVVLDTNVVVSGILSSSGPPAWIVEAVLSGDLQPAFDARIRTEYEEVLHRKELRLNPGRVAVILETLDAFGFEVSVPPWADDLPDQDDAPFLAVADALRCVLVTGNLKHFPAKSRRGVVVLTPRQFADHFRNP